MTESISFDLYKLNNTNNVSEVNDTEKSDETTSESKTSNPITIPIGESTGEETVDLSTLADEETNKKLEKQKIPHYHATRAEINRAKNFLNNYAKSLGMDEDDMPEFSKEQKQLFIRLAILLERGEISEEEFKTKMDKALIDFDADDMKKDFDNKNSDVVRNTKARHKRTGKFRAAVSYWRARRKVGSTPEETEKLQIESLVKDTKDNEKFQKKYQDATAEALPDNCEKDVADDILESTLDVTKTYNESILTSAKKAGYSKNSIEKLSDTITKTYDKIYKNYTSFVEKFWESAKGQAIKSYARMMYHRYLEKKEECEEKQAVAEQKKEEALIAEKEAQKAQEEANKKKAAADALLSKYKADELPDEKKSKALMRISPRAALQKQWADADLKKAKDVEYDAQSAKRLAVAFAEIAEKSMRYLIALAEAQMQAIMQMSRMG